MLPLTDIKVIDFATIAFAPGAAALLSDWGADVIKVEETGGGDPHRFFTTVAGARVVDFQYPFEVDNRGKRSLALDVKKKTGMEALLRLAEKSDVFISNIRTASLKKLGIDYENLSKINPKIIYAHASGYGEKGPDAGLPGYDSTAFFARSGIMGGLGEPECPPPIFPPGYGDHVGSLALALGIMIALYNRQQTGLGQEVDASLLGAASWCLGLPLVGAACNMNPPRMPSRKDALNPLANTYRCKDNSWLILMCLRPDLYWPGLCKATGLTDIQKDPRFETIFKRAENRAELIGTLDSIFASKTRDEWAKLLDGNGVVWGPVQGIYEAVNDPQLYANNILVDVDHPEQGKYKNISCPVQLSRSPASIRACAPKYGQHTEEVLLELGYSWEEIGDLKDAGVIP